jgi:post-segregation antitoxin (ccd killing protein)
MAKILTKTKVIRITETQHQTLQKMKSYNIDVGRFIREAISEKIKREYDDLLPKPKPKCPF